MALLELERPADAVAALEDGLSARGGGAADAAPAEVSFSDFLRMMKVIEERGLLGDLNSFITNLGPDLSSFF